MGGGFELTAAALSAQVDISRSPGEMGVLEGKRPEMPPEMRLKTPLTARLGLGGRSWLRLARTMPVRRLAPFRPELSQD